MIKNTSLIEKIRTKYASGLYSNTELVIEFAENLGAFELIKVLTYEVYPEICADKKQIILDMPKVQEIVTEYHKNLRREVLEIEDTGMDGNWRDKEFTLAQGRHKAILKHKLVDYPWVTDSMLHRMYHE